MGTTFPFSNKSEKFPSSLKEHIDMSNLKFKKCEFTVA